MFWSSRKFISDFVELLIELLGYCIIYIEPARWFKRFTAYTILLVRTASHWS